MLHVPNVHDLGFKLDNRGLLVADLRFRFQGLGFWIECLGLSV